MTLYFCTVPVSNYTGSEAGPDEGQDPPSSQASETPSVFTFLPSQELQNYFFSSSLSSLRLPEINDQCSAHESTILWGSICTACCLPLMGFTPHCLGLLVSLMFLHGVCMRACACVSRASTVVSVEVKRGLVG